MSVAEQMTLDSRGSMALEDEEFLYRPIPSLVPVSMAFVLISLVASIWDVLLIVPLIGATLAVMALRQIRHSQGTLSGSLLATASLSLQVAMFVGFAAMHAYSYATEVPPGYERINFTNDISKKGFTNQNGLLGIHPDVQKLVGQKVMIKGYMYPTKQMTGIKSFVLCRDNGDCCFGGQPKTTDMILVKMNGDKTVDFHDNKVMVSVSGVFKAEPTVDETGLQPVYQLEGEFFGKAKTLY
ncbi:MAG: DUF4190 domain-containing protein [Planctomycetota bacterium]